MDNLPILWAVLNSALAIVVLVILHYQNGRGRFLTCSRCLFWLLFFLSLSCLASPLPPLGGADHWLLASRGLLLAAAWLVGLLSTLLAKKYWVRLPWLVIFALAGLAGLAYYLYQPGELALSLIPGLGLLLLLLTSVSLVVQRGQLRGLARHLAGLFLLGGLGLALTALGQLLTSRTGAFWLDDLGLTWAIIFLNLALLDLPYPERFSQRLKYFLLGAPAASDWQKITGQLVFGHGWAAALNQVLEQTVKKLGAANGLVLLRTGPEEESLEVKAAVNLPKDLWDLKLPEKGFLAEYLRQQARLIVAELLSWQEKDPARAAMVLEQFSLLRFAAGIPVINGGRLEGLILLGEKPAGKYYTLAEVNGLTALAADLVWVLAGARLEASKLLEFERIFTLTGELAKAYALLREKNEDLTLARQKLDQLTQELTASAKALADGENLINRYQEVSQQMLELSSQHEKREKELNALRQEREAFRVEIEALTETNRRLLTSTEGFATVSRELYEATKKAGEAKSYLENVLSRMSNGVVGINLEGRINTFNRAVAEMTGLALDDVLGQPWAEVLPSSLGDPDQIKTMVDSILAGQKIPKAQLETTVKRQGQPRPVAVSCALLKDAEGEAIGAIIVLNDLSERKQLEAAVAARSKLESISEMAVSLNHEINNPLTSVLCNVQYVLNKILQKKELAEQNIIDGLQAAEKESRRIKKILESIRRMTVPAVEEYLPGTKMISFGKSSYQAEPAPGKKTRKKASGPASAAAAPGSDRPSGAGSPNSGASE